MTLFMAIAMLSLFGMQEAAAQSNNTNKTIRISGTIGQNALGCSTITDQCTGVVYVLGGDYSANANGNTYCVTAQWEDADPGCGVTAWLDVKSIKEGECPEGGTFCD